MTDTDRTTALGKLDAEQKLISDHTLALHQIGQQLSTIESWFWAHLADIRDAARQQIGGPLPDDVTAVEPEASDPTQCSGNEGFCPEHGFHRHSLKQPGLEQPACIHPEGYEGECPCPSSCVCCPVEAAARTTPDNAATSSDGADNPLRADAEGWRHKAIRRALTISKLQGTIHAVTDLASEEITARSEWGDGYRAALADLQEVLREFNQLQPAAHDGGPSVAEAAADDRTWPLEKAGE